VSDALTILAYCGALLAAAMAVAVFLQGRRSVTHWSFAFGMVVLALEALWTGLSADSLLPNQVAYWQQWRLYTLSLLPGPWLLFALSYARGEAGKFLYKWRPVLVLSFIAPPAIAVVFHNKLISAVAEKNPGEAWLLLLTLPGVVLNLCLLLGAILVLMNLERTFRAAVGTMRWRIKFMVLGLGVLFAVRAYTSSQALLFRTVDLSLEAIDSTALLAGCGLILRSLCRAGHFEVNLYPSQSILHSSVTVLMAGTYLLVVGVLAKLVAWFGGVASLPLKSFLILVSLVLLSVLLLSDRVRLFTKRFVSRHFQRPMHDYRRVWRTFTEGTARCVERTELCNAIVKLVSEMFQALGVTIWLADDKKEDLTFAASTSFSEAQAGDLKITGPEVKAIERAFAHDSEPVDIDGCKESWAVMLGQVQPEQFRKGGNRVCVPLSAGGEFLGIMLLGDRVGGLVFSLQDMDLLKSVADQAAASLLNIQLSQKLSQAKQLEAFQAMSAFFVHDLKNTASTLSLMLQNLPLHFQDPSFREDALRGISKMVEHINNLISRLSILRHELTIRAVECDLNRLVSDAVKTHEQAPGVRVLEDLTPLPKVRVDPIQIEKVLMNLLVNAREAVGADGQVTVQTSRRNGWVVLAVADNGCGMSPEFIAGRLFRPFQTTKKRGIGIGMFHCKMIVEAHRGRIEVESEPGKGTAFRVLLPISGTTN
jgi:putative PEP-CTERM system histidine kinase